MKYFSNDFRFLKIGALISSAACGLLAMVSMAVTSISSHSESAPPPQVRVPPVARLVFVPHRDIGTLKGEFGRLARLGKNIFLDTKAYAGAFVGNDLRCSNCHLDAGKLPYSAPLWAAYVAFPAYRAKTGEVNTYAERLQGCFRYSMNGHEPPLGSEVLLALETYSYTLAYGAPTGVDLPGRGYLKLDAPAKLDVSHGRDIFSAKCVVCHGIDGRGQKADDGELDIPPLWGERSFNWGAGLAAVNNAVGFIKAFMPLGQGGSLSNEDAWDVAAYVDSRDRPQDPRFIASVAETRAKFHSSPFDLYGQVVEGRLVGAPKRLMSVP